MIVIIIMQNPDFGCGNGWLKIHFGGDCSGAEIGAEIGVTVKDFNGIGENRKTARDLIRKIVTSNLRPVLTSRFFNF